MELTLDELRKLIAGDSQETAGHPYRIGKTYLIRTVTMAIAGTLVEVFPQELLLKDAAWIADTGRFADAVADSSRFIEVEPFVEDVVIGRGAIVDATIIAQRDWVQK